MFGPSWGLMSSLPTERRGEAHGVSGFMRHGQCHTAAEASEARSTRTEASHPNPDQHVPTARLCRPGVDIAWR